VHLVGFIIGIFLHVSQLHVSAHLCGAIFRPEDGCIEMSRNMMENIF